MRECICVHIGQAGCQIGNIFWELCCLEHNLTSNGNLGEPESNQHLFIQDCLHSFFDKTSTGSYVPRSLFIDLEPSVIDGIQKGTLRDLFNPAHMITGKEDAANNYARGHYTIGKGFIDETMDKARKIIELCDGFQGFFFVNSMGGGTGSGFSSLMMEKLSEYNKKSKLQIAIFPAPQISTAIVEPYNTVFATNATMETADCTFMMDNEAIYRLIKTKMNLPRPTYSNLNHLISQVLSSLTASLRFDGELNVDMCEFQTNLVPYPRIHFPITGLAPILSNDKADHEQLTVQQMTSECFQQDNQLTACNPQAGKYMSCCLLYRGNVAPQDVNQIISKLKSKQQINFVDWCPTGFKIGFNRQPPKVLSNSEFAQTKKSVCMLSNTTSIKDVWAGINRKFDLMYKKRAFIHWFVGEGMEEGEFIEARENLQTLVADYNEIEGNVD